MTNRRQRLIIVVPPGKVGLSFVVNCSQTEIWRLLFYPFVNLEFSLSHSFLISRFGECLKKFRVRIFQDLPDLSEVGEDLQAYCATALKADDSKFWSKLK